MRKMIATLSTSVLLFAGFAGAASAQVEQDGLVNVNIGDVSILNDADVAAVVNAAVGVCPNVNVGAIAILVDRVDSGDVRQVTLCRTENGRVTITQND
jgi:predicted SpoU family rRNA methylase